MKEKLKKERNSNMKKIIFSFMMVGATILNANDLELVGKNVLKNSNDIEMIKKELEVIKQKLNIDANKNLFIEGDKIIKFKKSENDNSSVAKKYKAIVNTVIRFSPSEFSQVIVNVKKGQELTEENFYTEPLVPSAVWSVALYANNPIFTSVDKAVDCKPWDARELAMLPTKPTISTGVGFLTTLLSSVVVLHEHNVMPHISAIPLITVLLLHLPIYNFVF